MENKIKLNNKFICELLPNGNYIVKKKFLFFYTTLNELVVPPHIINASTLVALTECYYKPLEFKSIREAKEYIKTFDI